ncbi:MAG: helix-turn-helix-domain containing protein AraC type, partial [Clostridia bacterium]|nr:helix-turn-helix-domain containing protein AraC type [Clostridia bacterium]
VTKIINEIMFCPYEGAIKRIYLEGKILELIAVYMSECIFEEEEKSGAGYNLSLSDISALHKVRELLDEHFIAAPTLKELSKKVFLNEYKLKIGFKELFGMPVHAYIIDKRLEMARYLIEEKKIRVTEAVQLVGYSDASHFAAKFKKKYGISPSWCLRNG